MLEFLLNRIPKEYVGENKGMKLVGSKKDIEIFFNAYNQCYTVFKNKKMLVTNKYKFSDVKTWIN